MPKAIKVIRGVTTSNGVEMPGLVKRREAEVALYLYGEYGHAPAHRLTRIVP
ncbi:MAG: hypothetical protein MZV65_37785 [Chromatiales bacterium]|nr:hypothetical protein [Chromatiales bacterium]